MKTKLLLAIVAATTLLFASCDTSKEMTRGILSVRASLGYDMTSPEYLGEKRDTVVLDFIPNSNMDYYSSAKGGTKLLLPLIIYNIQSSRYDTRLGEGSLTRTYREFLTEAIMAEVNGGQPLTMVSDEDGLKGKYRMSVRVVNNVTTGIIKRSSQAIFWFDDAFFAWENGSAGRAATDLTLHVTLTRGGQTLLDKDYTTQYADQKKITNGGDLYAGGADCVLSMAESLSIATKILAEKIAFETGAVVDMDRNNTLHHYLRNHMARE
jgi:hypothetical protein